jgi:glutaredoxin
MAVQHATVPGKKVGDVFLYALSTCVWCRKTKRLLEELGVEYSYIDVDLLSGADRAEVLQAVSRWNPARSFPVLVINDSQAIVGFDEKRIREALAQNA